MSDTDAPKSGEPTTPAASAAVTEPASAEPGKTFTQDQVNDLIAKEKGKFQQKYGDYDALKDKASRLDELEQANASELEKAQGKLTKAEQAKADAEAKLLRYEVAAEKKVPPQLVPLLTAGSKEELEAQADLILENAKPGETPDFDGGAREPAPDPKTPEQAHGEFLVDLFRGKAPNT